MQISELLYLIDHLFLPPKLPQKNESNVANERALCAFVQRCANQFLLQLPLAQRLVWSPSFRFLGPLYELYHSNALPMAMLQDKLGQLAAGDTMALLIRAQNAAVKIHKTELSAIIELFEVSLPAHTVIGTTGKVICTYPGPAFELSNSDFHSPSFQEEFSSFLAQMDVDVLEAAHAQTKKAGSNLSEYRESTDPMFIIDMLSAILAGFSNPADVKRVQKRIGDDVVWNNALLPWRRSPMWLVIRVTLQTSLLDGESHGDYKSFMLFCMTQLLHEACDARIESDLLHFMRSKLSRRFFKLDGRFSAASPSGAAQFFHTTLSDCHSLLQRRWEEIQETQASSPLWNPEAFDILRDVQLALPNARKYLIERIDANASRRDTEEFKPHCEERLGSINDALYPITFQHVLDGDHTKFLTLMDFETHVVGSIDEWVERHLSIDSSCSNLSKIIDIYMSAAQVAYRSNHEQLSIMLLTIFELWVALDRITIWQCPLLKEYSPEISVDLLASLVLPKASLIDRVSKVETYLRKRAREAWASGSYSSVFDDGSTPTSFAVRYYDSSDELKALEARITRDAGKASAAKIDELNQMRKKYDDILQRESALSHGDYYNRYKDRWQHDRNCEKCSLSSSAASMRIEIFESPLPEDEYKRKTVVFELRCPPPFAIWRSSTYHILFDVCSVAPKNIAEPPIYTLKGYRGLAAYVQEGLLTRISLASHEKSFYVSHYQFQRFPADEKDVLLRHGLKFRLFDQVHRRWVANSFTKCDLTPLCTPSLPSQSSAMQYAVATADHTANEVLAKQSECPIEWNTHEYIAFCSLRSGGRTQWLNILRAFAARELPFRRPEVEILIFQAAHEIGPVTEGEKPRDWHIDLDRSDFRLQLLDELEVLLNSVKENWLNIAAVRIIITLALRILHHAIEGLAMATEDDQISKTQLLVCEVAMTCRSTYDADPDCLHHLFSTSEDVAIFVQCAMRTADNTPPDSTVIPPLLAMLLARDRRMSHAVGRFLFARLQERFVRDGLDEAVGLMWGGYSGADGWSPLASPSDRWIMTHSLGQNNWQSVVHFNLLDGTLLIDGARLNRLPPEIVRHPTYKRIFGSRILNVIPSNIGGMQYSTLSGIHPDAPAFYAHFSLVDDQLLIQARAKTGTYYYELIPHTVFGKDFPTPFSEGYSHWLELPAGISYPTFHVEFRPLERPWKSTSQNWILDFHRDGPSFLQKPSTRLLSGASRTFAAVARRLRPLEAASFIVVTEDEGRIVVKLPRYRLSFFLDNNRQLQSYTHPGFMIDDDQSAGTFFGLGSQLILRSVGSRRWDSARRVLVPVGVINWTHHSSHTQVTVATSGECIRYRIYEIDASLGRLVGDGTLFGRLYQVQLHALTSHCLPDPLTSKTGVEEALTLLGSAGCMSFQSLTPEECKLLSSISSLTPRRDYYPRHLEVMQRIKWQDLPIFTQHYGFAVLCENIWSFAKDMTIFDTDPGSTLQLEDYRISVGHLDHRAAIRCRIMYPPEVHLGDTYLDRDVSYIDERQTKKPSQDRLKAVAKISRAAYRWCTPVPTLSNLWEMVRQWGEVAGLGGDLSPRTFAYSRNTLTTDFPANWISLYQWCRQKVSYGTRFALCFMLGALSLTLPDVEFELPLTTTLLQLATNHRFRDSNPILQPPSHSAYRLADGMHPSLSALGQLIKGAAFSLENTPSDSLLQRQNESLVELEIRREADYERRVEAGVEQITQAFSRQWDAGQGPSVPRGFARWIDSDTLTASAEAYFCSCRANVELETHIHGVQTILGSTSAVSPLPDVQLLWADFRADIIIQSRRRVPSLQVLLSQRPAPTLPPALDPFSVTNDTQSANKLSSLINTLQGHGPRFHKQYAQALQDSHANFLANNRNTKNHPAPTEAELERCYTFLRQRFDAMENLIHQALSPHSEEEFSLFLVGNWPRLSLRNLLFALASTSSIQLSCSWRKSLTDLALALLFTQRTCRLRRLASANSMDAFRKEISCESFSEETALQNPDWLLIQLESDFMIRPIQSRVASKMINPSSLPFSGHNTVLQLNMGEGKSSVIVPLVATTLADGKKLVRVIVLKPLGRQMRQLLTDKLGGLANRRVFYLPFSRRVSLTSATMQTIRCLHELCIEKRGVLIAHPEHLLSFKLAAINYSLLKTPETALSLVATQKWLDGCARDILDESDEILHVQYQLIYTSGKQQDIDDSPHRWITISNVLRLAALRAGHYSKIYPDDFEYQECGEGKFPRVRVLNARTGQILIEAVARDLIAGDDLMSLPNSLREAVFTFITSTTTLKDPDVKEVKSYCYDTITWRRLLLLRGLLGHGLILHTLMDRRWKVNFGLLHEEDAAKRTMLAVPYVAKDVPSPRADFGHPDVVLVLTYLSYYYQGLSSQQLYYCFDAILKQDDGELEYKGWAAEVGILPNNKLWHLSNVNVKDGRQWKQLLPLFQHSRRAINFYLASAVFPKEAKQFPHKLSTSAWDLAALKAYPTTGFSGTNDSQFLLPTSISQVDPAGQLETNAKVLSITLQPENDHFLCVQSLSSSEFLQILIKQSPPIRVLLDVGAQMLDIQNGELAELWLSLVDDRSVGAAVFVDDSDEFVVYTRDGSRELLATSPFKLQLDKCLIYLDDVHTRGTDLKIPRGARAAVTLGPNLTKDRLLQGCMRMRMLGDGHSIMFFAPPEVSRGITALQSPSQSSIHTEDILRWAMANTCQQIVHHGSRWAMQGIDFERRERAWVKYKEEEVEGRAHLECAWHQPDGRSLEEMYGPEDPNQAKELKLSAGLSEAIHQRLDDLGVSGVHENKLDEEQQRELAVELETQEEKERPLPPPAKTH
ncbi:hypothetical protein BOTBODRAFT_183913, partial [Botryobasidium botryosum FD-172 SS1]